MSGYSAFMHAGKQVSFAAAAAVTIISSIWLLATYMFSGTLSVQSSGRSTYTEWRAAAEVKREKRVREAEKAAAAVAEDKESVEVCPAVVWPPDADAIPREDLEYRFEVVLLPPAGVYRYRAPKGTAPDTVEVHGDKAFITLRPK
jgi:hypothetical protein